MILLAALALPSGGCAPGRGPVRMVQLCLPDAQDIPAFVMMMNEVAQKHRMIFTDTSGAMAAELDAIQDLSFPIADPVVHIWADAGGEFSFGGGNVGVPTRQMAISFLGRDPDIVRRFSEVVVARLATRWRVQEIPEGRGALPMPGCD